MRLKFTKADKAPKRAGLLRARPTSRLRGKWLRQEVLPRIVRIKIPYQAEQFGNQRFDPAFFQRTVKSGADVSDEQDLSVGNKQNVEEHIARELLHYFTGVHPTGVRYEDQPEYVKDLWLGAARVALKALQEIST